MREFKFRAFFKNEVAEQMLFDEKPGDCLVWKNQGQDIEIVMQFTGLKDKNSVEIYEGDILEYPDLNKGVYLFKEQPKRRGVMKWHEQEAAFKIPGTGFRINTERVEVIGNIYENPELMEEQK